MSGVCGRLCNPSYWDSSVYGWAEDRNQSEAMNSLQMFFTLPEKKVVFTGIKVKLQLWGKRLI